MDFLIRPYGEADRPAVIAAEIALQEHERDLHDTRLPGAGNTEAYFEKLLGELAANSGAIFVAEAAGIFAGLVAGFIESYDFDLETPDSCVYGYCSDIYVAPEFRGTGLARMLLDVLERHLATQAPIARFRINVLAVNRIACRAYERAGFVPYEIMYERLIRREPS
jgi:ribosomal protein S18 acetylase RimI-like enzyme